MYERSNGSRDTFATAIQTSMLRMILLNAELESAADPAGIDESEAEGVIYVRSTDTMNGS